MALFWETSSPVRLVRRFCEATNARDRGAMAGMMADDFRLIDNVGDVIAGQDKALAAFRQLTEIAPDLRIEVTQISARGRNVYLRGMAFCSDPRFRGTTLWRATADARRIYEWQGFSARFGPPLVRILAAHLKTAA